MPLSYRWTGRQEADLIGHLRMHCYAPAAVQLGDFVEGARDDDRAQDGDFLVVERDGRPVGTATSLSMRTHIHGGSLSTNGVAYVGTIRTERRRGTSSTEKGVATLVMEQTVQRARDRGDVVSTLMPFRASFYEHFGYGLVERRAQWTLPMGVLPGGGGNYRPYEPAMLPALKRLRQSIVQAGQCDHERTDGQWNVLIEHMMTEGAGSGGFVFVDLASETEARAWVMLVTEWDAGIPVAKVFDWGCATVADLRNLIAFLGSLKDQYIRAQITLPIDYPLNRMLKESQVPHRPVAHPTPQLTVITRMQLRVIDHKRLLEAFQWRTDVRGSIVCSVRESEGHESRFRLTVEAGRAEVRATTETPGFTCPDRVWAAIVCGELSSADAVHFGLADGEGGVLRSLALGRKPFCHEYF